MSKKLIKYAFIDRDGTLIYEPTPEETKPGDIPYQIDSIKKLKILPGVIEGLKKLLIADFKLVIVSNQDGLGTDVFPQKDFDIVQNNFLKLLEQQGIIFEDILICPHLPGDDCNCRKPKTGLLNDFIQKNSIDREKSMVIGNGKADRDLAKNLNLKFIEIKTNTTFNVTI